MPKRAVTDRLTLWRQRPAALLLFALLLLVGCAGDPFADYSTLDTQGAIQRPHPSAVPQSDRTGQVLDRFDLARSFFPLALSGALVDYNRGPPNAPGARGFNAAFLADFNAVTADPGQPLDAQLMAADGSRLMLLRARPDPATDTWGELQHAALLSAGAMAVIAMPRSPSGFDTDALQAFAASARTQAGKPIWALLPASARTGGGERLPDPAEARLLAISAIMAGASGLIWQGEDNYVARNAGLLGIAPVPQLDYGIQTGGTRAPLRATPDDVATSRRLWDAVAQLNRRIGRIAPALLQPDAADHYSVATRIEAAGRPPAQLRSLLKPYDGGLLLIVLNAGGRAEDFSIGFSRAIRTLARLDEAEPVAADPERGLFRDLIEPRGLRIYKILLAR
jgi:hypothetical protein